MEAKAEAQVGRDRLDLATQRSFTLHLLEGSGSKRQLCWLDQRLRHRQGGGKKHGG